MNKRLPPFRILSAALMLLAARPAAAQRERPGGTDTLRPAVVDVVQQYIPQIRVPARPELRPLLPVADTTAPVFTYEVPQQTLNYSYRSLPLRPLALKIDSPTLGQPGFVRLGGGNRSTRLAEIGYATGRGEPWTLVASGRHLSQRGVIRDQRISLTEGSATGSVQAVGHNFFAQISAYRNGFGIYGFNPEIQRGAQPPVVRSVYSAAHAEVGGRGADTLSYLTYAPRVRVGHFGARGPGHIESTVGFTIPVEHEVDSNFTVGLQIGGDFTRVRSGSGLRDGNNVFSVAPHAHYSWPWGEVRVVATPTWGRGGVAYLLPDASVEIAPGKGVALRVGGGYMARLHRNTIEELAAKNPYLGHYDAIGQTRADEGWIGLRGAIGQYFSYTLRGSRWRWHRLPLFINDFEGGDPQRFRVLYAEEVTALSGQASLRYAVGESFALGVTATLYNFTNSPYARVWGEPGARLTGEVLSRPAKGLELSAYTTLQERIYTPAANSTEVRVRGVLDLGGTVRYAVHPRFGIFATVTNALNRRYVRWYGYPAIGLAAIGGIQATF